MLLTTKATKQWFQSFMLLFYIRIMLCNVVLTFESVDKSLKCDHSIVSISSINHSCCMLYSSIILTFEPKDYFKCDHSNKTYN